MDSRAGQNGSWKHGGDQHVQNSRIGPLAAKALMAEKVNHHIVPQFYLRSFATGLGRKSRVTAFDCATGEHFVTAVRNVGALRHFNRIKDKDGQETNALEDAMSLIEAEWAPLFRDVIEARTFPSSKHREAILTLVATLSVRSGRFRKSMMDITEQMHTKMMDVMLSSRERWEKRHPDADVPYEELKRFWDSREFDLSYEQTYFIGHELDVIEPVYEALDRRNWCFVTPMGANCFITGDDPVVLTWQRARDTSPFFPPGHGLMGTTVTFALSPGLAINGTFEAQPDTHSASDRVVAALNGNVARHAQRQFFARDLSFSIATQAGIVPATQLKQVMRAARKAPSPGN